MSRNEAFIALKIQCNVEVLATLIFGIVLHI